MLLSKTKREVEKSEPQYATNKNVIHCSYVPAEFKKPKERKASMHLIVAIAFGIGLRQRLARNPSNPQPSQMDWKQTN